MRSIKKYGKSRLCESTCIKVIMYKQVTLAGRQMRPGGGKGPPEKNHPDIIGGGDNNFLNYRNV